MIIKTTTEEAAKKATLDERRGRCGSNKRSIRTNERGGVGVVYTIVAGSIAIPALVFASMYALSSNKSFERSTVRFDRPGTYVGGAASGGSSSSGVTVPTATSGGGQGASGGLGTGAVVSNQASVGTIVGSVRSSGQPRSGLGTGYAVAIASNQDSEGNGESEQGEDDEVGDSSNNSRSLTDDEFSAAETRDESSGGGSEGGSSDSDSSGTERSERSTVAVASFRSGPAVPVQGSYSKPQDWCGSAGLSSAIPEVCILSGVSVVSACAAHDACYGSAADRVTCDYRLKDDILAAGGSWLCGQTFLLGVRIFGQDAYVGSGDPSTLSDDKRPGQCASGQGTSKQRSTRASESRTVRSQVGTQRSLESDECAAAAATEQERLEALYDASLAALIVASELVEGDGYGAGGALVGIVISYNTGDSLAGGAAAGAQIGSLIGILISGDEEALRDWAAAQATNYAGRPGCRSGERWLRD